MGYVDVQAYILTRIPEGTIFMSKHVLHLGSRADVDTVLSYMVRQGWIHRLHPGVFFRRYSLYDTMPTAADIAKHRLEAAGEIVRAHGADAAASFGLEVPPADRPRFYTSARTRTVRIGPDEVRFTRVPGVYLGFPDTRAGTALAALHHLGAAPRPDDVAVIHEELDMEDRWRIRDVLMRLPDRTVSAWLAVDPEVVPTLPARIGPRGRPGRQIHRRELIRQWREENRREAARWPRIRPARPIPKLPRSG